MNYIGLLYGYIIVCGIFAAIYAFGRVGVYLMSDKWKLTITQDDNVNNYLKVGFGMFAVWLILFVVGTILAPALLLEPLFKKHKKEITK